MVFHIRCSVTSWIATQNTWTLPKNLSVQGEAHPMVLRKSSVQSPVLKISQNCFKQWSFSTLNTRTSKLKFLGKSHFSLRCLCLQKLFIAPYVLNVRQNSYLSKMADTFKTPLTNSFDISELQCVGSWMTNGTTDDWARWKLKLSKVFTIKTGTVNGDS